MPVHLTSARGLGSRAIHSRLVRRAEAMLALLQLEKAELSLFLSDDEGIQELNKSYRGKNKPTDVLAFPMREGDFGRFHEGLPSRLLGDVIVSVPTAERQARAAKRDALAEITMLTAHGLLHLLGWDHDTAIKDKRMRAETDRLVAAAEASDVRRAPSGAKRGATGPAPKRPRTTTRASRNTKQKAHKRAT